MIISMIIFTQKYHLFWGIHSTISLFVALLTGIYFLQFFENSNLIEKWLLVLALLLSMTIVVIVGFLQYIRYLPIPIDRYNHPDPGSLLGLSNFTSHYLVISLPIVIFMLLKTTNKKSLKISLITLTLLLTLSYLTIAKNRASLLAAITTGSLWIILQPKGKAKIAIFTLFAVIMLIAITGWWQKLYTTLQSSFNLHDPAIEYRLHLWKATLSGIEKNPAGFGTGEFRFKIWQYIDPFLQRMVNRGAIVIQHAHNEFLEYSIEGSILLLIFLLLPIFFVLKSKEKWGYEPYSLTAAGTISFFSFPLHMPVSLLFTWMGISGSKAAKNWFIWRKKSAIKIIIILILIFYSTLLGFVTISEFHSRKGIGYIIHHKYALAEREFTIAISYFPFEPNYFYNRGVCRENLGFTIGAIRDLKREIKLSSYQPQGYKMLGVLYLKEGDKEDGIRYLEKFLQVTKTPIEMEPLHFIIAGALDIGKIDIAKKYINIALEKYGDNKVIQMDYLALLMAERKNHEAIKILKHIEEKFKNLPPEFYMLKIQLYKNLGLSPLKPMQELIQMKPDPQLIVEYLKVIDKEKGEKEAYKELLNILQKYPSLLNYILSDVRLREIFEGGKKIK